MMAGPLNIIAFPAGAGSWKWTYRDEAPAQGGDEYHHCLDRSEPTLAWSIDLALSVRADWGRGSYSFSAAISYRLARPAPIIRA